MGCYSGIGVIILLYLRHSQLYLIKIWQLNKKGHNPTLKGTRQDNPKERQLCPKTNLSLKRI